MSSEGQRWLWQFFTAQVRMYYDTVQWLREAGLPDDAELPPPPKMMMYYWQRTGQYANARAYKSNAPAPPYMPPQQQINKCPSALPVAYFAEK